MNPNQAVELLRRDPLRHIVSLKMLARHGDSMDLRFIVAAGEWALASLLPTRLSDYDSRAYPLADFIVLVDGKSEGLKLRLLEGLPRAPLVVKTYDEAVMRYVAQHFDSEPVASFTSFTASAHLSLPVSVPIEERSTLSAEAMRVFAQAEYGGSELERHFRDGARWFGLRKGGALVSACFVYRSFDSVWEIAGVFTEPGHRRQGLAAIVVCSAVKWLLQLERQPRYQVPGTNLASMRLARKIGLREFLRVDHFLVAPVWSAEGGVP